MKIGEFDSLQLHIPKLQINVYNQYIMKKLLFLFLIPCYVFAQNGMNTNLPLLFQTGFEPSTRIIPEEYPKFAGKDETLKEKNDWEADISPLARNLYLNSTSGKVFREFAKIIPEPGNPSNHVMHFKMHEGWMNGEFSSARMQCDFYGIRTGLKEFYQTVRIFLPDDMKVVGKYPRPIHWLTILEIWNNVTWSQKVPYGFRITLGMGKVTEEESDLIFILDAEDCELFENGRQRYTKVWVDKNHDIKVPIGEWFTMHYYFKEGDDKSGRFITVIETEKHGRQTVFDITNYTHNTGDPAPDGVTEFNPFKLYTSMDLANFIKAQDKTLQIYWDDFKLYGK